MTSARTGSYKRRSGRLSRTLSIDVAGTDAQGRDFCEPSRTIQLSYHGAKIFIDRPLVPDQQVTICREKVRKDAEARIVALIEKTARGYFYGIEFAHQDGNFWNMNFPPAYSPQVG